MRKSGYSITDWLHEQSYDLRKKKEADTKRANLIQKKRMKPVITEKARMAKP